jgi:hypothetical protein
MRIEFLQISNRFAAYHVVGFILGLAMFFFTGAGSETTESSPRRGHHSTGRTAADPPFDLIFAESNSVIGHDFSFAFVHRKGNFDNGDPHLGKPTFGNSTSPRLAAPTLVPEPSTGLLLAAGLVGLAIRKRDCRRNRRAEPVR